MKDKETYKVAATWIAKTLMFTILFAIVYDLVKLQSAMPTNVKIIPMAILIIVLGFAGIWIVRKLYDLAEIILERRYYGLK